MERSDIAALRKVKGAVAALDRAKVTQSPSRRVKVTVKTRDG
jgi:hypothetical protein